MRLFDCFTIFNEIELLKIRCEIMKELNPIHILVESPTTHTGDPKPLHFEINKHLFDEYNIVHIVADLPNNGDPWANENAQRDAIMMGFINTGVDDVHDDDWVIISDLDEIPRPSSVRLFDADEMLVAGLKMDKFSYYLNCLEGMQSWESAKLTSWKYLKTTSPQKLRVGGFKTIMLDAGWHWSWLGGVDKILEKFQSFAHQESNNSKFADPDVVAHKFANNISMWGDDSWKIIPVDDYFPKYIRDNEQQLIEKGLIKHCY